MMSVIEAWTAIWSAKWMIAAATSATCIVAATYAFTATPWYRADVLLSPANSDSAQSVPSGLRSLAGLAGLVGFDVANGSSVEAIAVLRSRDFARRFIEEYDLVQLFFADQWDEENDRWESAESHEQPDIRDAVDFFDRNVRRVSEDGQTGLVTLSVEWTEPDVAAQWATILVVRLNEYMRQRALREAQENIAFLEESLDSTTVATLRQSIGALLESELQKLMLARGTEEFSFRVIDPAQVPKDPERPRRLIILALFFMMGLTLSTFFALMRHTVRRERQD